MRNSIQQIGDRGIESETYWFDHWKERRCHLLLMELTEGMMEVRLASSKELDLDTEDQPRCSFYDSNRRRKNMNRAMRIVDVA